MKKIVLFAASCLLLSACNTAEGLGEDMASVGQAFGNLFNDSMQNSQQRLQQRRQIQNNQQNAGMSPSYYSQSYMTPPPNYGYGTSMASPPASNYGQPMQQQAMGGVGPYDAPPPIAGNMTYAGQQGINQATAPAFNGVTAPQYPPYYQQQPAQPTTPYYYNQ